MPSATVRRRRPAFANRQVWATLHLCAAAFLAPVLGVMVISGGLYLLGIKGHVTETPVALSPDVSLDAAAPDLEGAVRRLLAEAGVEHRFEYLKREEGTLTTRPTSRVYYVVNLEPDGVRLVRSEPSLQKRLIELHKGHGPTAFKTLQKVMAAGLLIVVGTGLWLGLSAAGLRGRMAAAGLAGFLLFAVAAFVL